MGRLLLVTTYKSERRIVYHMNTSRQTQSGGKSGLTPARQDQIQSQPIFPNGITVQLIQTRCGIVAAPDYIAGRLFGRPSLLSRQASRDTRSNRVGYSFPRPDEITTTDDTCRSDPTVSRVVIAEDDWLVYTFKE